jgi:hypothetical protein
MKPTASYTSVAILAPGSYTDMSGKRISFTPRDLQQLAARYGTDRQPATLNLDHARSGPALGRVSALRYDPQQQLLLADLDSVPGRLARAIERGRWPGRSAELAITRAADGSVSSLRLKGLALLGARRPAVEGLPPMPPRSPGGQGQGPRAEGRGELQEQHNAANHKSSSSLQPSTSDLEPSRDSGHLQLRNPAATHTFSFTGGLHD